MINFNQLGTFYFTAKHLNFTKAAEEPYCTQPAVTAYIQLFEEVLNLKLLKNEEEIYFSPAREKSFTKRLLS